MIVLLAFSQVGVKHNVSLICNVSFSLSDNINACSFNSKVMAISNGFSV